MAKKDISIVLKATDEASKVLENAARNTLPAFAKAAAQTAAALVSVGAATGFIKESVQAALDAEKATARLGAAIRAQGLPAEEIVPRLTAYANALSKVSTFSDEAIQGVQQTLISVGGLIGPTLDKATKAAMDLSVGLGIDLSEAATRLAKAAQGAVKPFTQLGLEFKKGATDAEKLNEVLGFVQERFGGMAANELNTAAGATARLNEAWGELKETFGGAIITTTGLVGAMQSLTTLAEQMNVQANNPKAQGFWKSLALIVAGAGVSGAAKGTGALDLALLEIATNTALAESATTNFTDALTKENAAVVTLKTNLDDLKKSKGFVAPLPAPEGPFSGMGADEGALTDQIVAQQLQNQLALLNGMPDALALIADGFIKIGEQVEMVNANVVTFGETMNAVLIDATTNAALQLGDAMVDAAFGAKVAWDEALRSILSGLVKAVVQALILRAISAALTGGAAPLSKGGVVPGGPHHALAGGGVVPSYAAGGMFTPRGTDTVPAMLTPGEIVIPRGISHDILGGRASVVPSGAAATAPTIAHINIGGARLASVLIANSGAVVEVMDYIEARRG